MDLYVPGIVVPIERLSPRFVDQDDAHFHYEVDLPSAEDSSQGFHIDITAFRGMGREDESLRELVEHGMSGGFATYEITDPTGEPSADGDADPSEIADPPPEGSVTLEFEVSLGEMERRDDGTRLPGGIIATAEPSVTHEYGIVAVLDPPPMTVGEWHRFKLLQRNMDPQRFRVRVTSGTPDRPGKSGTGSRVRVDGGGETKFGHYKKWSATLKGREMTVKAQNFSLSYRVDGDFWKLREIHRP